MFTGIIEATGALASRQDGEDGAVLRIAWSPPEGSLSTGESVAVRCMPPSWPEGTRTR